MNVKSLLLRFFLSAILTLSASPAGAEMVSFFAIRGEHLPQWDVHSMGETRIFRANSGCLHPRLQGRHRMENDEFEQTARAYAK